MGCTSSAPNMVTPKSNTAEKNIQFKGEMSDEDSNDVEEIIYRAEDNDKSEINVLPSCDTLTERIQVVRNKSNHSLHSEKDGEYNKISNLDTSDNAIDTHDEEKIPKLEEVVNQVVELYIVDHIADTETVISKTSEDQSIAEKNENATTSPSETNVTDDVERQSDEEKKDELQEALSPSQSESSRATRWEALADIAAELPPSLAVDPVTGQIYSLTR